MENFHESSENKFSSDKKGKKVKSEVCREAKKPVSVRRPWLAAALGALAITGGMTSGGVDAAGTGLSGRRSEGLVLHPYLDKCPRNDLQIFQDSYSQPGVCSLTENMEHLSVEQQGAKMQEAQHSDGENFHQEKQKFVEAIKKAFKNKEFLEKYLEYISKDDNMMKKIVEEMSNPSDEAQLREMLNDPAKRKTVIEELSQSHEKVDEVLKDPRLKKKINDAYKAGYTDGWNFRKWHTNYGLKIVGACAIMVYLLNRRGW